ncbi:MFS transporter [Geodermatophilus sabuli]|uniref:Putative proline/betaine transporter n=1 Tax=Geodermatophilus sabuli TaxID=1564158 RepID=A0A285EJW4_9ACTN|nr:MFS transporter [Geodermatophilus sabuli]MBB3083787.1 MFS family permease [Geodermatophilus sabuli]SNX99300.1 Na+/melibiose symporter [Geodermatophilus sabuli]
MHDVSVEPGAHEPHGRRTPKKAAISAWIGSALEYYDFFIYGTAAALVFPQIFFPEGDPAAATIASLATFGVAYVARPVGSFILGHVGDTLGRKNVLLITLFGMGIATFLIGVLPTYGQIGYAAPILLLVLRVCQGLAVAGEQSSASSMSLEHAPPHRRAFFTSFTLAGTQFGLILATAVFIPIAALPTDALLSWGWRIPFLLSAVVMLVAWWIRRTLHETPAFEEEQEKQAVPKTPLKVLFKHYTPDVLKVMIAALVSTISTILSIYSLTYGVNTIGLPRTSLLWMLILSNIVALGAIPLWGMIGDRIGRKPVFAIGALGPAVLIWPFIWSVSQANLPLVFLFGITLGGIAYSAYGGVGYALWSEQFDTKVRMSGVAVGTQFGFALGGFAPTIAAALAGPDLENWVPVAVFGCAAAVVATISVLTMRETHRVPMHELGRTSARETPGVATTA